MTEKDSTDYQSLSVLQALLQRPGFAWCLADPHGCRQEPVAAPTARRLLSILRGRPAPVLIGTAQKESTEVRWTGEGLAVKRTTLAGPLGGSSLQAESPDPRIDRTILGWLMAAGAVQGELDEERRRELGASAFLSRLLNLVEGFESPSILECAAGPAPVSLALQACLLRLGRRVELTLLDEAEQANMESRLLASRVGLAAEFLSIPISSYEPVAAPDMLLAVHACGQATLEALALGLELGVSRLVLVPCCAPPGSWSDAGSSYGEAGTDPRLRSRLDSIGQIVKIQKHLRQAGYETYTFEAYLRPWRTVDVGLAAYLSPP